MKFAYYILALVITLVPDSLAQFPRGIKTQNLKGADLALMSNHDPDSELANFEMLPGYQVNLFAADPMLANPVHMNWDSKGRLWVACSWAYPQIKPGDVANDKIIILEDSDDDGVADKSTIFAEGLYIPTGLELANGGCYVGQSPDVFFLKDIDGDDISDVKELALTGFGIEDSHHSISAWRRGPGGWIYFQEGIFLHSQIETQYGMVRNFNGGVYQFNPRTQELKLFCRGTGGNPWGHVFDRWGQSFMVNNPRIMYLSPASGNSGESVPVGALISTEKQCGGDLATGTHVGEEIRGQLLTGRFKSRQVVRYEFIENGAGFDANVLSPLMSSKHPNFRPVDVKTGPDGAIYVADWYNSIINHAQHDFRDPRRDNEHGRIWRVTHQTRPLVEKPKLAGISIEALVNHLKSPQTWTRHQARKELSERDPDQVLAAVERWVEQLPENDPGYDHHLVEAMWACQNVERISEAILKRVLESSDGHARSAGARILRYWHHGIKDPIAAIAKLARDPFPRTRMEAVLSAGFIPNSEAYAAALHVLDYPPDKEIDKALNQTTKALAKYYRPAMERGEMQFAKASHKLFVEQGAGIGFKERLNDFLKQTTPELKEVNAVKNHLLSRGTGAEFTAVIQALTRRGDIGSDNATKALLQVLVRKPGAVKSRSIDRRLPALIRLLDHNDDSIVGLAAETLGAWKVKQAAPSLLEILEESSLTLEIRKSAAVGLAMLDDASSTERLLKMTDISQDIIRRYAALHGIVRVDVNKGVEVLADVYTQDPGKADPVAVLQTVLKNVNGPKLLSSKLEEAKLHPVVITKINEFHRSTGQLPESLLKYFTIASDDSVSLSALLLAEDQESLTADVVQLGDPYRGEMVYRRPSVACVSCHAIGSAGATIGPNLVAVGAAASPSYMVESILKPNAAIAEHYENRMFTLNDGTVQMGIVTFKSEKEVIVIDSALGAKEVRMATDSIKNEQILPSLMPAGLADQLNNRQEFLDLAKFLSVLGRPGDFANNEKPMIRKWRVTDRAGFESDDPISWLPAYSKVDGSLPAKDLLPGQFAYARGFINVQLPGSAKLMINSFQGIQLWLNDQLIGNLTDDIELTTGRQTLTFKIDRNERPKNLGLSVEVIPPNGSPLKFQVEGGL